MDHYSLLILFFWVDTFKFSLNHILSTMFHIIFFNQLASSLNYLFILDFLLASSASCFPTIYSSIFHSLSLLKLNQNLTITILQPFCCPSVEVFQEIMYPSFLILLFLIAIKHLGFSIIYNYLILHYILHSSYYIITKLIYSYT